MSPSKFSIAAGVLFGCALMCGPAVRSAPASAAEPILLLARDAITHGVNLRYEPETNKNCLGFWTDPRDWAEWKFEVGRSAPYEIRVWQGCGKGQGGSDVVVETGGRAFEFMVEETGHFQIFLPRRIGLAYLQKGTNSLAVKPRRKAAAAVMDIQKVELVPVSASAEFNREAPLFARAHRVVFLGDSITYSGQYIEWLEAYLRLRFPEATPEILNLGLPSETVSGLSEPGHAGGAFPRPDLHERLKRVLEQTQPDLIVACYGMNDGIYYPFSNERFARFQEGVQRLREQARAAGVAVIHLTPPVFDAKPLQGRTLPAGLEEYRSPFTGYDGVLDRYSAWLLDQRSQGWIVIDVHGPMRRFIDARRKEQPDFVLARDGVHPNAQGQWLIVRELLRFVQAPSALTDSDTPEALDRWPQSAAVLKLVQARQRALKDPWLTAIGHQRPGMARGKPLDEARREAADLEAQLRAAEFWVERVLTPPAQASSARHGGGPVDADDRPLIRKLGTVDLDLVETTPIVVSNRLWRFEWVRDQYWNNPRRTNYFRFRDPATGAITPPFADGHEFGSAFVLGNRVYVTGTHGRARVNMFASDDLQTWDSWPVIDDPRYGIFNTSICRAADEFVLMFEIDRPAEEAGIPFTARFAKSKDLRSWTLTPPECQYSKDRYTAPHALRWLEGWFYNFYLEAHQGYEMRVVRSPDLVHWEPSPLNPVLRAAPEDKRIAQADLNNAQRTRIALALNLNNSDIDFCEWNGRLIITYSWGNQQGIEHLAEAVYDGSLAQFLTGWFPER